MAALIWLYASVPCKQARYLPPVLPSSVSIRYSTLAPNVVNNHSEPLAIPCREEMPKAEGGQQLKGQEFQQDS